MDAVSRYLDDILTPTLLKYEVSDCFTQFTVETVAMQMNSLLRHWDDYRFRSTVLLLGLEEGSFYEPESKLEIRSFVVTTLRNSPIEVILSESYSDAGLKRLLPNQEAKNITSAAVRYFSKQNFDEMCEQAKGMHSRDIYEELRVKYPVAWTSLQMAAISKAKVVDYPKTICKSPYLIEGIPVQNPTEGEKHTSISVVLNGYDPTIDRQLMEALSGVGVVSSCLVTDSFKGLTRNVEKLFRIMEFILTRGYPYVTANYYLENGHVEKRVKLLRAGHDWKDIINNLSNTSDLGYRHREILDKSLKG